MRRCWTRWRWSCRVNCKSIWLRMDDIQDWWMLKTILLLLPNRLCEVGNQHDLKRLWSHLHHHHLHLQRRQPRESCLLLVKQANRLQSQQPKCRSLKILRRRWLTRLSGLRSSVHSIAKKRVERLREWCSDSSKVLPVQFVSLQPSPTFCRIFVEWNCEMMTCLFVNNLDHSPSEKWIWKFKTRWFYKNKHTIHPHDVLRCIGLNHISLIGSSLSDILQERNALRFRSLDLRRRIGLNVQMEFTGSQNRFLTRRNVVSADANRSTCPVLNAIHFCTVIKGHTGFLRVVIDFNFLVVVDSAVYIELLDTLVELNAFLLISME